MQKENVSCIADAIAYVMANVPAVGKTGENKEQKYKYRPVDEFMNKLGHVCAEVGLVIIPCKIKVISSGHRTNAKGSHINTCLFKVKYTLAYKSEREVVSSVGFGEDFGDKHSNKALAFAYKYALMQTFMVPTKDLVDGDESSDTNDEVEETITPEMVANATAWLKTKGLYPNETEYNGIKERKLWASDAIKITSKMSEEEIARAKKAAKIVGVKLMSKKDEEHPLR